MAAKGTSSCTPAGSKASQALCLWPRQFLEDILDPLFYKIIKTNTGALCWLLMVFLKTVRLMVFEKKPEREFICVPFRMFFVLQSFILSDLGEFNPFMNIVGFQEF